MVSSVLTAEGQVTLPSLVRTSLGVSTGDMIEFEQLPDGRFAIAVLRHSIRELKGVISKPEIPVSIEDMNLAIAKQGAKAR